MNLKNAKKKLKKDESDSNKIENKQRIYSIIVGGNNNYNQLGQNSNNTNYSKDRIISPPMKIPIDTSSILSFSVYGDHSVLVMNDGSLKGVGNISGGMGFSLCPGFYNQFTDFWIKDERGHQLIPLSAVCTFYGALFLDIGNHEPVSLYGGYFNAAAICTEGEIIFINRYSFKNSPLSSIEAVFLPEGEKASSVAFCSFYVVALCSNGSVFLSPIEKGCLLKFKPVSELADKEIICISGTSEYSIAVSKEGRVFGSGKHSYSFKELESLNGYKIRAAYAGYWHCLFETCDGKILACGINNNDELLLGHDVGKGVYTPTPTVITRGAAFCIAGYELSVVFVGNSSPPNMPNMRVQHYK